MPKNQPNKQTNRNPNEREIPKKQRDKLIRKCIKDDTLKLNKKTTRAATATAAGMSALAARVEAAEANHTTSRLALVAALEGMEEGATRDATICARLRQMDEVRVMLERMIGMEDTKVREAAEKAVRAVYGRSEERNRNEREMVVMGQGGGDGGQRSGGVEEKINIEAVAAVRSEEKKEKLGQNGNGNGGDVGKRSGVEKQVHGEGEKGNEGEKSEKQNKPNEVGNQNGQGEKRADGNGLVNRDLGNQGGGADPGKSIEKPNQLNHGSQNGSLLLTSPENTGKPSPERSDLVREIKNGKSIPENTPQSRKSVIEEAQKSLKILEKGGVMKTLIKTKNRPITPPLPLSSSEQMAERMAASMSFEEALKALITRGPQERFLRRLEALPPPTEELLVQTGAGKVITKICKDKESPESTVKLAKTVIEHWRLGVAKERAALAAATAKKQPAKSNNDTRSNSSSGTNKTKGSEKKPAPKRASEPISGKPSPPRPAHQKKRTRSDDEGDDDDEWERERLKRFRASVSAAQEEEERSRKIGLKEDRDAEL